MSEIASRDSAIGTSGSAAPDPATRAVQRLPFAFAKRFGVCVIEATGERGQAVAACKSQPTLTTLAEIKRFIGRPLQIRLVAEGEFEELLTNTYARDASEAKQMVEDMGDELDLASLADSVPETEDLLEQEDDAPIIRLINALLAEAIRENASDIHIETFEKDLIVRFRVDGVMREVVKPKRQLAPLLVSRIKVMARLDIAEKRIPQDGRISLRIGGREVDVRVSTMPASNGERVVLRLLDKQAGRLRLENLGMLETDLKRLHEVVHRPHGIFLVTGPTGSGKTTTLYASLSELSTRTINILTVEDPIEYNLAGIGQTQVNNKADMTFARGLRAMLRQDPDVVMVGEIRDLETAETAVQASLTGHLVMSTLHTNTAVGAITRLVDMGIEPFLLSSSLVGMLAQRLVRVLCLECKTARPATPSELDFLQQPQANVFEATGCEACQHTGYKGRTGIYELVLVDETLRQLIHDQVSEQELTGYARRRGPGIRDDGKEKILAGVTSVQEVLRVTLEEALQAIAQQSEKQHVTSLVMAIRSRVLEGHSLASSLAEYPGSFSQMYRSTVAAGEQSGYLDKVLENLAVYNERQFESRRDVDMAMLYPAVLTVLAFGIVGALMVYVVPDMVGVLETMGQELPLSTRFLIAASEIARDFWWLIALGIAAIVMTIRWALAQPNIRLGWDRQKLVMPLVSRITRSSNAARYANTLSILTSSGVPLVEAMNIAAEVVSNQWLKRRLADATQRVSEGSSLRAGLEAVGYFPPMLLHMVASGESSGQLDMMLDKVAVYQQAEVERIVTTMVRLFEPLMLLVMGGLVMFIVMAILLPILNMNQLV